MGAKNLIRVIWSGTFARAGAMAKMADELEAKGRVEPTGLLSGSGFRRWAISQCIGQLMSTGDAKFLVGPLEVAFDGSH